MTLSTSTRTVPSRMLLRSRTTARFSMLPHSPRLGDIGEERKHIELEPLERPSTVPATVPVQEPVPA